MEETKDEIKYENKQYLGKKLVKTNEGGKGKWEKLWKLSFQNGQFEQNMSAFDPTGDKSLNIPDLVEGEEYCVGFKISPYEHPKYGTVQAKQMIYIGEKKDIQPKEAKYEPQVQADLTQTPAPNTINLMREDAITFYNGYVQLIKQSGTKPNLAQFIGLWYRMNQKDSHAVKTLEKVFTELNIEKDSIPTEDKGVPNDTTN